MEILHYIDLNYQEFTDYILMGRYGDHDASTNGTSLKESEYLKKG